LERLAPPLGSLLGQGPRILFPDPGSTLLPDPEGRISVRTRCPAAPCTLYINGRESPAGDHFVPPAPGFYTISLVDANGESATSRVEVREP
ncbi:MAG: hypothetical protein K6A65_07245, partial [Succinivibrionaceae bacterium]|nr:hypothetical protein [Succinivibrionaceae bacterium]